MKVYLKENKLYYSEIEVPSLGDYLGDYNLTPEEIELGTWDGNKIVITERSRELKRRALSETDLDFNKQEKIKEINTATLTKLNSGFLYQTFIYDSNDKSVLNIHGAYTIAKATNVFSGSWWDMNNVSHSMTIDEFLTFAEAFFNFQNSIKRKSREMKNTVLLLTEISEIKGFEITWN